MKGYWIVRADVTDMARFREYAAQTPEILASFGGRFLARAGQFECVEGSTRSRNSIIEFPSYAQAQACWASPAYQAARELRLGAGELDIVIVEGLGDN
ncbi:DUF1330 domain-containing protein [Chitinilyticum piscinae]|uniref:DUF1330 domain-containing protein n=1 Tax=Chitinilyticum piscinae TaxID=2866724 RepID=A0A8J7K1B3_9NEIS|nr:DUF1330 domain-containing protein [Chitinilyticum piscinae]MBE9608437.1 DUF1330 domain-containing protein [Chitinilyticum piscinae]